MKIKDMKQAVNLLMKEWDLGAIESGTDKKICALIYLMEILEETEKFVYYRENGKLLGFAGYSKNNSRKYIFRKKFYTFIKNMLYKSKKIKDLESLKEYQKNYEYTPKELENYFDGEISILILDEKCRGKGIGKGLLNDIFKLAKIDNISSLKILSDESCNYGIYEKLGCKKVYETVVENKEYGKLGSVTTEKAYVYEKKL